MASTAVILDIRANTQKALGEFKKFSAQLDNKFLISGLKLDVVRNALSQINKEFQRAVGEQGLSASSSLRAAENQAALLTSTFKDFSLTAAKAITDDISNALNQVAVTAGGTMDDVKAALQATPFISNTLSQDLKKQLTSGILEFQRDIRRAGLGDEFGTIAKDILSGQASVQQLIDSASPVGSAIGRKLQKAGVNDLRSLPPAQRTQLLQSILNDKELQALLKETAKETAGYKIILEDLNTALFNPKSGIFGYLREVTLQSRNLTTNVFKETYKLVDSVFGKEGLFVNFFRSVAKVFGIEDPLKFIIRNIIFLTDQFNKLNNFIQSEAFQNIITKISEVFSRIKKFFTRLFDSILEATGSTSFENLIDRIGIAISKVFEFFTNIYKFIEKEFQNPNSILGNIRLIGTSVFGFFGSIVDTIKAQDWDPKKINQSVKEIGDALRKFIKNVGKSIREIDVEEQGEFFLELFKKIIGEIAETLGTAIKEAISLVFSGKGMAILGGIIDVLYESLSKLFKGVFGGNEVAGKIIAAITGTAVLAIFAKKMKNAVMAFADKLAKALPGTEFIKNKFKDVTNRKKPDPAKTQGPLDTFQRTVIGYLRNIERCVCKGVAGITPVEPDLDKKSKKPSMNSRYLSGRPAPQKPQPQPRRFPGLNKKTGIAALLIGGGAAAGAASMQMGGSGTGTGGILEGAGLGASIGMLFGPKGIIAGAIIGGIAGWVKTLDRSSDKVKAILDPLGEAFQQITDTLGPTFSALGSSIMSIMQTVGNLIKMFGFFTEESSDTRDAMIGLKIILTPIVSAFQLLEQIANVLAISFKGLELATLYARKGLSDMNFFGRDPEKRARLEEEIILREKEISDLSKAPGEAFERHKKYYTTPPTNNFAGLNAIGPTLAQESRMSGGKAMVVNNKEFVIPPGGFSTLANLVALKNTTPGSMNATQAQAAPVINISVSVSGVLSESDLEDTLREPVSNIVEDAYRRASATTPRGVAKTV
jgi:hypothetical protein